GPILGTILFMASLEESMIQGGVLLFIYSLGMAIPFIITAIFINKLTFFMTKYEKVLNIIPYIGGIILMVFGLLIFFDKLVIVSNLLT
ncbi:cytochrome c biogenesis protein CcdA, partial [Vibrio parahaemolyticus]|nr:cytochrome c biogenesis protein CcdA [Vibrio parahaemolyticus]